MIDFMGALMTLGQTLGSAALSERARKKDIREKQVNRDLDRRRLVKETGNLSEDLTSQYLSSGLDPASLQPKISSMFSNIDKMLDASYGKKPIYKGSGLLKRELTGGGF
jgi:hypothetical protein